MNEPIGAPGYMGQLYYPTNPETNEQHAYSDRTYRRTACGASAAWVATLKPHGTLCPECWAGAL